MTDFPTGLPDIPNAVANPLSTMHTSESHVTSTNRMIANILALATKIGYGSSSPGASAAVLRRTANGQSAWGQVAAGDYAAGSIATADLAANAITQRAITSLFTNSQTTTSTTPADITNGSITMTTVGGDVLLLAYASMQCNTLNAQMWMNLAVDGSNVTEGQAAATAVSITMPVPTLCYLVTGLSAASHTFKAQWRTSAGTLTMDRGRLVAVELKR